MFILSGALVSAGSIDAAYAAPVANFFIAGNITDRGGVRVTATDADGDQKTDVAAGSGEGDTANVRVYRALKEQRRRQRDRLTALEDELRIGLAHGVFIAEELMMRLQQAGSAMLLRV